MASAKDKNFKRSLVGSTPRMSLSEVHRENSAAATPPAPPRSSSVSHEVEEPVMSEGTKEVKRGFYIDLNVEPPEEEEVLDLNQVNENGCDVSEEEEEEEEEEKEKEIPLVVDSEDERDETKSRNRRWGALLDVSRICLCEYEKKLEKKERKSLTAKKRTSEATKVKQLGNGSTRKKISRETSESVIMRECGDDFVVLRSTRSRAVAMPNKFRDSVIEPVAVPEFPRLDKSGKSVAVKRKFR